MTRTSGLTPFRVLVSFRKFSTFRTLVTLSSFTDLQPITKFEIKTCRVSPSFVCFYRILSTEWKKPHTTILCVGRCSGLFSGEKNRLASPCVFPEQFGQCPNVVTRSSVIFPLWVHAVSNGFCVQVCISFLCDQNTHTHIFGWPVPFWPAFRSVHMKGNLFFQVYTETCPVNTSSTWVVLFYLHLEGITMCTQLERGKGQQTYTEINVNWILSFVCCSVSSPRCWTFEWKSRTDVV